MVASNERIREVVETYLDRVAHGTSAEVVALFAEGASVEDPVGSEVRSGEGLREFYAAIDGMDQETRLLTYRAAPGAAAFHFEIVTRTDGLTVTLAPIELMTFDDDARITSMRAYWSDADLQMA